VETCKMVDFFFKGKNQIKKKSKTVKISRHSIFYFAESSNYILIKLLLKMGLGDKINPHRYTQVKLVGMCED
jgi:hypothetical protein